MIEKSGHKDKEVGQGDTLLSKKSVRLAIVVGSVLAVALLVVLGFALRWYLSPNTDLPISQRQALVQGVASAGQALAVLLTGAVGLIGLYLTRKNTNEQLRQARESTQETLQLTEQGQITERFTRAIEQLGATDDRGEKKLEIRLGGIYALERIARDSPERDYSTVMEVLMAYVRENSHWEHEKPYTSTTTSNEVVEQDKGVAQEAQSTLQGLPTDIRAILDVLKRREEESVSEEHRVLLDLREANLQQADLREADLKEADLRGANLEQANLLGADLQGADLSYTNLLGASLYRANLQEAHLSYASLWTTNLYKANLQQAILVRSNLSHADLQEAQLQGAQLQEAQLQEAQLRGAQLQEADLRGAKVTGDQLAETFSLRDATMPTGEKHP